MMRIRLLTPRGEIEREIEGPVTLGEAAAWMAPLPQAAAALGIWGQVRPADTLLKDGDRVECYEPLRADPKTARRRKVVRPKGVRPGKF